MKYPPDFAELSEDRVEDINRDRFYVSETVDDCCSLLGGQVVMLRLGNLLQAEYHRINGNFTDWQGIEACFACIQSINKYIPNNESQILPFCFDLIPRLPADVQPLRFTASKLIGKYAAWLAMHSHLLPPLLPYLAQSLSMPLCASAAAVAIKELCERSNQQMAMGEPVLQLYNEITAAASNSGSNGLKLKDELEILQGVCRAVSRQIQDAHGDGSNFLRQIIDPIGGRLTTKINDPSCDTRRDIIPEIERLTTVVRFLVVPKSPAGSSPIVDIIHATWPLLESASNLFPQDAALAEKVCRLHKHAIRTVGSTAYAPLLEPLMEQLVRNFERSRQSAYLYAASICVSEYGRNPTYTNNLFQMINAMATVSFSFLSNLNDLTQHPDVVEELFYLMGRMMSTCPQPLVLSPLLQSLFQCAAVGMRLDHRDANKGTLNFIENSLSYGAGLKRFTAQGNTADCQRALEYALFREGQAIVNNLARALMGELPAYSIDKGNGSIAGILYQFCEFSPPMLSQWITVAVADAPERPRMDFLAALDSSLPRDDFNLAVRAFLDACKRERKFSSRAV
jgi:transportin-3